MSKIPWADKVDINSYPELDATEKFIALDANQIKIAVDDNDDRIIANAAAIAATSAGDGLFYGTRALAVAALGSDPLLDGKMFTVTTEVGHRGTYYFEDSNPDDYVLIDLFLEITDTITENSTDVLTSGGAYTEQQRVNSAIHTATVETFDVTADSVTPNGVISSDGGSLGVWGRNRNFYEASEGDVFVIRTVLGSTGGYEKMAYAWYDSNIVSSDSFISTTSPIIGGGFTLDETVTAPSGAAFLVVVEQPSLSDYSVKKEVNVNFTPAPVSTLDPLNETEYLNGKSVADYLEAQLEEEDYASENTLNLGNASMRCNFGTYTLASSGNTSDVGCAYFSANWDNAAYRPNVNFSNKIEGFEGYGISEIPHDEYLTIKIPVGNDFYVPTSKKFSFGFWIDKSNMVSVNTNINDSANDRLRIIDGSGGGVNLLKEELIEGFTRTNKVVVEVLKVIVDMVYIYAKTDSSISMPRHNLTISMTSHNNSKWLIHNYTYFSSIKEINPNFEYPTLYSKFGSNLVGKTLCLTGDSNGGAGVGFFKRLSWAARYLGLSVINGSSGGWSMQGRMLYNESNNYGWLFYHKWRERLLSSNADIYYFNQCTNDGYKERPNGYPDTENVALNGNDFGTFGDGSPSNIKLVLDTYTDAFATLLEAGDLSATYNGETLLDICRRDMTTLGCTGAFIKEVTDTQPSALCVMDSTIGSSGYVNALTGSFSASGIVASALYEADENGYVVFPPYLLTNVDVDGNPTSLITNGTITGSDTVITAIDGSSNLSDGNNYSLYYYYAYTEFSKDPIVDEITDEEKAIINTLSHAFYNYNDTDYGRSTPFLIQGNIRPDFFGITRREKYLEGVNTLRNWMLVPFIDAGGNTGLTKWNVKRIVADSGHYNARGMRMLGTYIANSLNNYYTFEDEDFAEGFIDYDKDSGLD